MGGFEAKIIMQMTDKKVVERILDFSDCRYLGEVHKIVEVFKEAVQEYNEFTLSVDM